MSEYFIARQPIFDRKLNLYAYELLFRSSRTNSMPPDVDAEMATAQVLSTSSDIGLSELVGSDMAFINLPNRFLREPDLLPLPPGQVVLEILESVKIDAQTLEGIRTLVERGLTLALDDFVYAERFEKVLPFVHIVKLEILAIDEGEWAQQIRRLKAQDCRVLAEKVETEEQFTRLAELGCDYFQGYFFARPKVVSGRRIAPNKLGMLQLLSRINDPETDIEALSELVSRDVALSVRALRYVNSAASALNRRIESIQDAVIYLGRDTIRNWIALFMLASIDDKPSQLMTMALIRGKFCELLGKAARKDDLNAYFTVGLFSVLDALMDATMEDIVVQLAVTEDMSNALTAHRGAKGEALKIAVALERGKTETLDLEALPSELLAEMHREATLWADKVINEMGLN